MKKENSKREVNNPTVMIDLYERMQRQKLKEIIARIMNREPIESSTYESEEALCGESGPNKQKSMETCFKVPKDFPS